MILGLPGSIVLAASLLASPTGAEPGPVPPGERWTYEVGSRGPPPGRHRLEFAVHPEGRRHRLVARVPGGKRMEVEGRPGTILAPVLAPTSPFREEFLPLRYILQGMFLSEATRGCADEAGAVQSKAPNCRAAKVSDTCGPSRTRVVSPLGAGGGPGHELDACFGREHPLPIALAVGKPAEPSLEMTLVDHGPLSANPATDLAPLLGLWAPRSDDARGLLVKRDGIVEIGFDRYQPRGATLTFCEHGPVRHSFEQEHLAVVRPIWIFRGIRVLEGREYRLEGHGARLRLEGLSRIRGRSTGPCRDRRPVEDPGRPVIRDDLVAAVERDDMEGLRASLARRVPADSTGGEAGGKRHHGYTPLQIAAQYGFSDLATILLDHGADPNVGSRPESKPLHLAVDSGDPATVRLLLARGARLDVGSGDLRSVLTAAARKPAVYAELLAAGVPPGYREMRQAIDARNVEALRTALEGSRWADAALRDAAGGHWAEGIRIALEAGAKARGAGVLTILARNANVEPMDLLIEHGADPTVGEDAEALASAMESTYPVLERKVAAAKVLLAHGADPNRHSEMRPPVLLTAVRWGSLELVDALLAAGADPTVPWRRGVPVSERIERMRPGHHGTLVGLCGPGREEATLLALHVPGKGARALVAEVSAESFAAFSKGGQAVDAALAALDADTQTAGGVALRRARRRPVGYVGAPPPRATTERTFVALPAGKGRVKVIVRVPAQCDGEDALAADVDLDEASYAATDAWQALLSDLRARGTEAQETNSFRGGGHGDWWSGNDGPGRFSLAGTIFDLPLPDGGLERRVGLVFLSPVEPWGDRSKSRRDVVEVPFGG